MKNAIKPLLFMKEAIMRWEQECPQADGLGLHSGDWAYLKLYVESVDPFEKGTKLLAY